jgi:hypothetical protein
MTGSLGLIGADPHPWQEVLRQRQQPCHPHSRASLDRTAEGGCSHMSFAAYIPS